MAKRIGTVTGTALVPGVSRNGRLYTVQNIAKAVERAQARIASDGMALTLTGDSPLTQRTHHAADDDSTRIVGRLTRIWQDESGAAKFSSDIADTEHGRTILSLVRTDDDQPPFLRNVSIRGAWVGPVSRIRGPNGAPVETADDLDLDGLDYTARPGVPGARIDTATAAETHPDETAQRVPIYESVQEALVTTTTEDPTEAVTDDTRTPTALPASRVEADLVEALRQTLGRGHVIDDGICRTCAASDVAEADAPSMGKRGSGTQGSGGPFADPGYQSDKKQRYQLDTKAHAKAAWSYINQADNAKAYTSAQLKRIKGRIIKALDKFGVSVSTASAGERYIVDPMTTLSEAVREYLGDDSSTAGSFAISLCNGPLNVNISSYCIDPADLDLIGKAAMDGACKALAALDPDMDGDIDVPGADAEDTDDDNDTVGGDLNDPDVLAQRLAAAITSSGESAPENAVTETPLVDPAPEPAAATEETKEAPAMAEPTSTAVEQAPAEQTTTETAAAPAAVTLTHEQFQQLLAGRPAAPAPTATESTVQAAPPAPVAETQEQMIARLVAEGIAASKPQPAPAPVAETTEEMVARLVAEGVAAAKTQIIQETVEAGGGPARKGLVRPVDEHRAAAPASGYPEGWPMENGEPKPMHKWNADERKLLGPALVSYVTKGRVQDA